MLQTREGQRVPSVSFRTRTDTEWLDVTSEDVFAGKTVVVFALPGAFTPTCSSTHLPRYEELADEFAARGVDDIVCISVNDAFVMNAWRDAQGAKRVKVLPDGNGRFTEAMGMLVDKEELGFGKRSWRYSMLVRDGVIEKMFIEPEVPGDPFDVSDADTMLRHLDPQAKPAEAFAVFTRAGCPHCVRAKTLLDGRGLHYDEVRLEGPIAGRVLGAVAGEATTPQVFLGGQLIGTADELEAWLADADRAVA